MRRRKNFLVQLECKSQNPPNLVPKGMRWKYKLISSPLLPEFYWIITKIIISLSPRITWITLKYVWKKKDLLYSYSEILCCENSQKFLKYFCSLHNKMKLLSHSHHKQYILRSAQCHCIFPKVIQLFHNHPYRNYTGAFN